MNRKHRTQLANETLKIIDEGSYSFGEEKPLSIREEIRYAVENSSLFEGDRNMPSMPPEIQAGDAQIEVTNESTFEAIKRISASGNTVGCLNFASAKSPGGGFLFGAQAQEEALARSSALYPTLLKHLSYYERNRANGSSLYLDLLILSPSVPFFRNDDGSLLHEPVLATVVTAPAPNAGAIHQHSPELSGEIETTLSKRAEWVLRLFAHAKVERLVLGAWGCGVFRNDPRMVAGAFASFLKPGRPYSGHFKQVVMAIYDPAESSENLKVFRQTFDR